MLCDQGRDFRSVISKVGELRRGRWGPTDRMGIDRGRERAREWHRRIARERERGTGGEGVGLEQLQCLQVEPTCSQSA